MAVAQNPRVGWTGRLFKSHAEADQHDAEYWMRLTPRARVELAWQLSLEQHQIAGLCSDAPRLDRTVERIVRR
ncbi:MAG: hypothetical protein ACRD0Y_03885 [Terriglobales bacterium]